MGWQWHQLDHMQITCTSLQTDNHTRICHSIIYKLDALPDAQPTTSKHWRQSQNEPSAVRMLSELTQVAGNMWTPYVSR